MAQDLQCESRVRVYELTTTERPKRLKKLPRIGGYREFCGEKRLIWLRCRNKKLIFGLFANDAIK